jgi:hypothetical protein
MQDPHHIIKYASGSDIKDHAERDKTR